VVLNFEETQSKRIIEVMKRETQEILAGSGVHLDWRLRSEVGSESFAELVMVTFKGNCSVDSHTQQTMIPGPLASTHVSGDRVQPFADVFCDHVAALTRPAIVSGEFGNADPTMGRALAKVLAHELMHMITKSAAHGTNGVAKATLTGRQLADHETTLESDDLERIREETVSR